MAFNIFATATSDIPLANLDANFTMIGSSAVASTLYPTATTSITYGTAGTSHIFSGSIGAFTLGGTVAGGGNQLNNVIIGTTTPLAGAFTTLSATDNTVLASAGITKTVQIGSLAAPANVGQLQQVFNGAAAWAAQTTVGGETDFGWNFYYYGGFKSRLADVASRLSFNATSGRVSFWTAPNPGSADAALTFTEALRIDATTGVTALGAMAVGNNLAVTGTLSATGDSAFGASSTAGFRLYAKGASATSSDFALVIQNSTPTSLLTVRNDGQLGFGVSATAMILDSSGNLGLGVTPSAWSALVPAFQVGGAFLAAQGTLSYSAQGTNAYYNGSNWIYRTTATASVYQQSGGVHSWQSAASGTAGNAITFTQSLAVGKGTTLALEGATSATGTGIAFPATQSASTDANTLDDYEEGTWTPVFTRQTGGAITGTASVTGVYRKIGSLVTIYCYGQISALTLQGTGLTYLTGIPFNPAVSYIGVGALFLNDAFTTVNVVSATVHTSGNIYFHESGNSNNNSTADWKLGFISFTITYYV